MVAPAEWNGKLIGNFATESTRLSEPKVMSIGRLAAADQASLCCDEFDMIAITDAAGFRDSERTFINALDGR